MSVVDTARAPVDLDALEAALTEAEQAGDVPLARALIVRIEQAAAWVPLPHQVPPQADWTTWELIAGRGCVDAATPIFDPVTGDSVRIADAARAGRPIRVLALAAEGPAIVWTDGPPFMKGVADMYEVTLDDGRSVTVTDGHRFLTPDGWRAMRSIGVGSLLGCVPDRLLTTQGPARPVRAVDGRRSTRTVPGSPGRCSQGRCQCGARLLPGRETGRAFVPSRGGVRGRTRLWSRADGRERGRGHNRVCRCFSLLTRTNCGPGELLPVVAGSRERPFARGRIRRIRPIPARSRGMNVLPLGAPASESRRAETVSTRRSDENAPGAAGLFVGGSARPSRRDVDGPSVWTSDSSLPALQVLTPTGTRRLRAVGESEEQSWRDATSWARVRTVRHVGLRQFYDMTVPGAESYLAHGIWHHNTGKTDAGSAAFLAHMNGPACDPRTPGGHRGRIIAPTFGDAVASCVNGPSGLRAHDPQVQLVGTKEGTMVLFGNGAQARIFGAHSPGDVDRLRAGTNSCLDWMEELAAWRQLDDAWDQAAFGRRLGPNPRLIVTTTPRNRERIRALVRTGEWAALARWLHAGGWLPGWRPSRPERIVMSVATTDDNPHLDPEVRAALYDAYAGTRLGEQELLGRLVDDLGTFFARAWFGYTDQPNPGPRARTIRYWDFAATPPSPGNEDPDWTVGARVTFTPGGATLTTEQGEVIQVGTYTIEDIVRVRATAAQVEQTVIDTAERDGPSVEVGVEQDPGQAGKAQVVRMKQLLGSRAVIRGWLPSGPKTVRAQIVAAAAEQGRVTLVRASWNSALLDELEEFDSGPHDDQVDALSGAFTVLAGRGRPGSSDSPAARQIPRTGTVGTRRIPSRPR